MHTFLYILLALYFVVNGYIAGNYDGYLICDKKDKAEFKYEWYNLIINLLVGLPRFVGSVLALLAIHKNFNDYD